MRHLLLLLLLLSALVSRGQKSEVIKITVTDKAAFKLPLLGSLSTLPQRLSADDSLRQLAYRRNHVRTVTLLQVREQGRLDTIDYTELNRQGQITFYRPAFGQAYRQRYSRRQQLVEKTIYPFSSSESFMQATYDPATSTTTTRIGPSLSKLETLQLVRSRQLPGDTTELEGFLHPSPLQLAEMPQRLVARHFRVGRDTSRLDVLGYDAAGQVVAFESFYQLGSYQRRTEEGQVSFGAPTAPAAAQWQASRHSRGRYEPSTRQTFDATGHLVRRLFIPLPAALEEQSVTHKDPFAGASITIRPLTDTTSARYVRAPDGQLLREEYWFTQTDPLDPGKSSRKLTFVEYTYAPNGLRQTKSGNLPTRYVYHYTYY